MPHYCCPVVIDTFEGFLEPHGKRKQADHTIPVKVRSVIVLRVAGPRRSSLSEDRQYVVAQKMVIPQSFLACTLAVAQRRMVNLTSLGH